jgi:hypothetical protein
MSSQVLRVVGMERHSPARPNPNIPSILTMAMTAKSSRMIPPFRQQRPPNGGFRRVPPLTEAVSYPRVGANATTNGYA